MVEVPTLQGVPTYNFAKFPQNCMKLKEFISPGAHVSFTPLLDPPMLLLGKTKVTNKPPCYDLTFQADLRQILILEHLHIIEVLMHANATIMFKDYRCTSLIVMMPL